MLGFPRGDPVFRPASVPRPLVARDPCGWVAGARNSGRARSFRLTPLPSRRGNVVWKRPCPVRRARHFLGDRARDHERAQGGRVRSYRRAGCAVGAAMGRPGRSGDRDALLERVGQSRRPADPRRNHRLRRATPDLARADRVRKIAPAIAPRDVSCGGLWASCALPRIGLPRSPSGARSLRAGPHRLRRRLPRRSSLRHQTRLRRRSRRRC